MKKIVRLTESDLVKLVKRVISEQQSTDSESCYATHLQAVIRPEVAGSKKYCVALGNIAKQKKDGEIYGTDNWNKCMEAVSPSPEVSKMPFFAFLNCVRGIAV